jgi:DNA-binding Lrp family transcriptional regulator
MANGPRLADEERQRVRDELKKDPKRSNRVVAALLNLSPDTVRHERDRMERDGKIPPVPREERVNSTGRAGNRSGAGSKIGGGIPLMQLASKGLLLEEENPGMSVDDVALLLGIHGATYRGLRSVRLLSLRDDLSKSDGKMVQETIERIEKTRQISPFWPDIKPIAAKIWGKSGQNTTVGAKAETKRKSAFDHAIGLIVDMCVRGPEVEIPYLAEEEQIAALHRVTEAINCLKQLNANIRRARG